MDFKQVESRRIKKEVADSKEVIINSDSVKRVRVTNLLNDKLLRNQQTIKINGRVVKIRDFNSHSYVEIQDFHSVIQVLFEKELNKLFLSSIDIGDLIEVIGTVDVTKGEQILFKAEDFTLVSKCRFIFPKKLKNKRTRYENRFLDFTINPEARSIAELSSHLNKEVRKYLWSKGFEEHRTPILSTKFNGGVSTPFTTEIQSLKKQGYLRVTSEIYLKQLIAAGFASVFEIGSSFRNAGMDKYHIPEFPLLEIYQAYSNADEMLELVLELVQNVLTSINGKPSFYLDDKKTVEVYCRKEDWKKINAYEVIKDKVGIDLFTNIDELREKAMSVGVRCSDSSGYATVVGSLIDKFIRQESTNPTIVYGLPAGMTPLMKVQEKDKRFNDRYWLYLNKSDFCDIGSEQTDYEEQIDALKEQYESMSKAYPHISINEDIIKVVSFGLPPTSGAGFSLSRFLMAISNTSDVRETPLFPYI
ncbi:amino acid--tRNA ligase-related protein [Bacillus subtilis]